jgi:hypothetical protein
MTFAQTVEVDDAMLLGIAALLDAHPNPAYAVLFDSADVALVTMVFAKPAASLVAHELVFAQGQAGGDMILVQGSAAKFELRNGAGVLLGSGDVSDMNGAGTLKVGGTTGTLLYEGARAILGELKMV